MNKDSKPSRRKRTEEAGKGKQGAELTDLETEIMQVVWERDSVTGAEVQAALKVKRPLAHTTVLTVLEKLRKKKVVHAVPTIERARRYRATVPKEDVANNLLANLMKKFFGDSPASLVAHMIKDKSIEQAELEEIGRLIEQSTTKGDKE
jgi:BlaI family transcriptional regulator, penicillinase repressor